VSQAVILAGGKGTRLAEVLKGRPKPLVDVDGKPLLQRQIEHLIGHGIDDIVILVNHAADQIHAFIAEHDSFGIRIHLVDDGEPRGTAGAVLACLDLLAEHFLVVYGDTLFNIDVTRFLASHEESGAEASLFLHPNDHPEDSDLVELDDRGWVHVFHPYPHKGEAPLANLVNAAFYAINRNALERWRSFAVPADFGKNLFPAMLAAGQHLRGYVSFEYIKDLGTPKRLAKVEGHLRSGVVARANLSHPQKAVFLDRDGTLNQSRGFIRAFSQIELIPGAGEAVRLLNEHEFRAVVITNQPVIARGECSLDDLRLIHARLDGLLGQKGAFLDGLFFCPHHPDSGFPGEVKELKIACNCRKPKTGLVERAVEALNINLSQSWFVGDTTLDIATARAADIRSVLVRTGEGGQDRKHAVEPDFVRDDIMSAVELIVRDYDRIFAQVMPVLNAAATGDTVVISGGNAEDRILARDVLLCELRHREASSPWTAQDVAEPQRGDELHFVLDNGSFVGDMGHSHHVRLAMPIGA
jgi:D,D-heptose 1,7-bisphosphate phosphatase